jgi:hypothetical protein
VLYELENYARLVAGWEWPLLAGRQRDPDTELAFLKVIHGVMRAVPVSGAEVAVRERLIDIVRRAGEHRAERTARSLTQIPPTLIRPVNTPALALLLLILVYPFHHWITGAICFALLALVLSLAELVMMDTDDPFRGVCNLSPEPFSNLIQ